ncbi:hypothetical protein QQ045_006766 [Rhodiola kirilowii]
MMVTGGLKMHIDGTIITSLRMMEGMDVTNRDEVLGSNGHEKLNRPGHENLKPFQQNLNSSDFLRNQNEIVGRKYNANQNQNVGEHRQNVGASYNERQEVSRVNGFEEQKIAHDGYMGLRMHIDGTIITSLRMMEGIDVTKLL